MLYELLSPFLSSDIKYVVTPRKARCRLVYTALDADESGYITAEEVKQVVAESPYKESVSDEDIERYIANADKDGDGRVSFEEFQDAIYKLYKENTEQE